MNKCSGCCNAELDSGGDFLPMFVQISGTLLYSHILPNKRWMFIRQLFLLIAFGIGANSIACNILDVHMSMKWYFIYYSHWILWLTILYFLISLICTIRVYQSNVSAFKPYWISLSQLHLSPLVILNRTCLYICLSNSLVVILAHWILVYPDETTESSWSILTQILDNGIIYVLLWIDYLCSLHDIPWNSIIYALGSALLYLAFTVIFQHVHDIHKDHSTDYIHKFLQWSDGRRHYGKALVISVIMLVCIIIFQVAWILLKRKQLQKNLPEDVTNDFDSKSFRDYKKMRLPHKNSVPISSPRVHEHSISADKVTHKNEPHGHRPQKSDDEEVELALHRVDTEEVRVTHEIIDDDDSSEHSED